MIAYYVACMSSGHFSRYSWDMLRRKYPPAVYTVRYLSWHLSELNTREHPDLISSFQHLLNPISSTLDRRAGMARLFYNRSMGTEAEDSIPPLEVLTLQIAIHLNLPITCQWLLSLNPLSRIDSLNEVYHGIPTSFLVDAVVKGHVEMIEVLLHAGADLNQHDQLGRTALYVASEFGQVHTVRALLDASACIDGNARGYHPTPLHVAASRGHTMIVQLLIDAGAEVDGGALHIIGHTSTPLQLALNAASAVQETSLALLNAGANVFADSTELGPPLVIAVKHRLENLVRILLDVPGANVNQKPTSHDWLPALHTAVREGYGEIAEMLINAGASVNMEVSGDCPTPLHIAARCGHTTIAQMLIDAGAHVDSDAPRTIGRSTPLQVALNAASAACGYPVEEAILVLLNAGANVSAESKQLGPPLVIAVKYRLTNLVQILLDVPGVNVNQEPTCHNWLPALHTAVREGYAEIIAMLINAGADVNMAVGGRDCPTPLHIAARCGHATIVQMLIDAGEYIHRP
jgi:uncharacterized protein